MDIGEVMEKSKFYMKFRKRYGVWFIVKKYFELQNTYNTLEGIALISNRKKQLKDWISDGIEFKGSYMYLKTVVHDFNEKNARPFHKDLDNILRKG